MATTYLVQAINLYERINIKTTRAALAGKLIDSSAQELHFQYGPDSFCFVYRFGCLVFFNVGQELVNQELARLKEVLGEGLPMPTTETYQVEIGEVPRIEFEFAVLKKLSQDFIRLICMTAGQSAALEFFEISAERRIHDTAAFMQNLARKGSLPLYTRELLKIIGSTASTRQHILSNMAILDPPDETWKSRELEKFHKEMQQNFEIETRFKTLDRKLTLIQDNIEILTDLTSKVRSTVLEALIVLLIVIELFLAFVIGH